MFALRTDLPFESDDSNRFLPWLVAFMVFLAALAVTGALVLNRVAGDWSRGVSDTLTVQLPFAEDKAAEDRALALALRVLRGSAHVSRAEPVDPARVRASLEPWLGAAAREEGLPLPRVIEVEVERGGDYSTDALRARLAAALPGAAVDDHREWLDGFVRSLRTAQSISGAVLALIFLVTVGTVVFATRTGLGLHADVIEILHLIGAQDSYIARQFAWRALLLGLKGGVIGAIVSVPTLLGAAYLARALDTGLLPDVAIPTAAWWCIGALVPIVGAIAMATARNTVMRTLAGMV